MNRLAAIATAAACGVVIALAPPGFAERWPDWAERSPQPSSSFQTEAPAVELLRETAIRFDGSNTYAQTDRRVIQIRAREGRDRATPLAYYSTDGGGMKSLRAWVRASSGKMIEVDDDHAIDAADVDYELYNEARIRRLNLPDEADAGAVVAWEAVVERRMPIPQLSPRLQEEAPVLRSRVRLELPSKWTPRATILNYPPAEPIREGSAYIWEFRDLPELHDEPSGIATPPRIGISLSAPGAPQASSPLRWEDVSLWLSALTDPQASITPALQSKARALTAGLTTPEQRVRALARYVQGVNYIAISMGLGRGGGYRPHAAADVLAKNYGDCKDKANLMKALLSAIGIESYLVVISALDPEYVRQEWPSPYQFDHCIIGVRAETGRNGCVADVPGFGPIALFDPTDPNTPWGSLPEPEQGAFALLVSARGGNLFRTPESGPDENHDERAVQARIRPDGALVGLVRERASGTSGADDRAGNRNLAQADFRKRVEDGISGGMGGVTVTALETSEDSSGIFGLQAAFEAPRYARPVAGFLSFRPVVVGPIRTGATWPDTRRSPLRLGLYSLHETGRIHFPSGYTVDEVPPPVVLEEPFAAYRLECRLVDRGLHFERSFRIRTRTLPASDYPAVRRFFEQIRAAEAAPLLLTRG